MVHQLLDSKFLLTDEQMAQFLTQGYLQLNTDFTQEFHETIQRKMKSVYTEEGNPGNNILPRIPEIQKCFDHPTVKGALTSILGPGYVMDAHRHGHFNPPGSKGMNWHKDDYWGNEKIRNHRPWYAMIFYYTQDVTEDMGPSGIMPGTQNYSQLVGDDSEYQLPVCGKAGSMALIDYDIWHTAMANRSEIDRFMLKFLFYRMEIPKRPTWNIRNIQWMTPQNPIHPIHEHKLLWQSAWNWLAGDPNKALRNDTALEQSGSTSGMIQQLNDSDYKVRLKAADTLGSLGEKADQAIPALAQTLADEKEPVALNAAYALAAMGYDGMQALINALKQASITTMRTAAYGLAAVGTPALPALIEALDTEYSNSDVFGCIAFALGEIGEEASRAVPKMMKLLKHDSKFVRQHTTEALGMIKQPAPLIVPALCEVLLNDAEDYIRFSAGLSLSRIGTEAGSAVPALEQALYDPYRYVSAIAATTLERIKSDEALEVLLPFLQTARWCPATDKNSRY